VLRETLKMSWLQKLGLTEDPFYLDPVAAKSTEIERGFINREDERKMIDAFVVLPRGRRFVIGHRGQGKSSILNVLECKALDMGNCFKDRYR
jgi:putative ribosome biogenesis GTPase RsgA